MLSNGWTRRFLGAILVAAVFLGASGRAEAQGLTYIWTWGRGNGGQLGNDYSNNHSAPVQIPFYRAVRIAAGGNTSMALDSGGGVWEWGFSCRTGGPIYSPSYTGVSGMVAISVGADGHAVALKNDGTVWTWGSGQFGQLGNGQSQGSQSPVQVVGPNGSGSLTGIVEVSAGNGFSVALKQDLTVWTWGNGVYGDLGNGNQANASQPVPVIVQSGSPLSGIVQIAASPEGNFTLALRSDGTIWAWGLNGTGQFGDGNYTSSSVAIEVVPGKSSIAAGAYHSAATNTYGYVYDWGTNTYGELGFKGNGTYTTPQFSGVTGATSFALGSEFSAAVTSTGSVYTWGLDRYGQLGINTSNPTWSSSHAAPVLVRGVNGVGYLGGIYDVELGDAHVVALGGTIPTFTVHTTVDPSGAGIVTITQSQGLHYGDLVRLTATTSTGQAFSTWTCSQAGVLNPTSSMTRMFVTGNMTVTAVFGTPYSITVPPQVNGFVTLSPSQSVYAAGTSITISAKPGANYYFVGWTASGCTVLNPTSAVTSFAVSGNCSVTASFAKMSALVTTAMNGYAYVNWSWFPGPTYYVPGTQLVISSCPSTSGYQFSHWTATSGSLLNALSPTTTLTIGNGDSALTAYFVPAVPMASYTVSAWGVDQYGQFGDGGVSGSSAVPVAASGWPSGSSARALALGDDYTVALMSDSTVWAWGVDAYGQLGNGEYTTDCPPAVVLGQGGSGVLTNVVAVAGGLMFTVALRSDGTVWTWGDNEYGEFGDGSDTWVYASPVEALLAPDLPLTNIVAVATAGGLHTVALRSDGTVWAWGGNEYGQLGCGYTSNYSNVPMCVLGPSGTGCLTNVVAVSAGAFFSMALTADGRVWTWGDNTWGELGDGTNTSRSLPVQVVGVGGGGSLTDIVSLASGIFHQVALGGNGTVYTWGYNGDGELGDGTTTDESSPVSVVGSSGTGCLTGMVSVSAGMEHTVALRSDGTVWSWGGNMMGELGDGTTTNRTAPVQVVGPNGSGVLTEVVAVAAGIFNTVALVDPPSPGNGPPTLVVTTAVNSSVSITPSQASYVAGNLVQITAASGGGLSVCGLDSERRNVARRTGDDDHARYWRRQLHAFGEFHTHKMRPDGVFPGRGGDSDARRGSSESLSLDDRFGQLW